jgi:lysophospholipase L1-like esterase
MSAKNFIKTAVIYGDSISTKDFGEGGYENQIKEKLGIEMIYNHAISSSGLSSTTPFNMIGLLDNFDNIHPEADLIIIWHGTNDWYWNAPLVSSESDTSSFSSDLETVIKILQEKCSRANIVFLTPLFRYQAADKCEMAGDAYTNTNYIGYTLNDYYEVIVESSKKLGFTVIDMRTLTNFHYYNTDRYMHDYVHPSKEGYNKIADILAKQIKNIFFFD